MVNQKIEQNSKSSCTGSMLVKFKTIPSINRDSSHVSPGEISSLYLELWPIDTFTRFHAFRMSYFINWLDNVFIIKQNIWRKHDWEHVGFEYCFVVAEYICQDLKSSSMHRECRGTGYLLQCNIYQNWNSALKFWNRSNQIIGKIRLNFKLESQNFNNFLSCAIL